METIKFYYYYYESIFTGYPFFIRIATAMVIILTTIYIITLIVFFFSFYNIKRLKSKVDSIENDYKDKLKAIMFSPENLSNEEIRTELQLDNKKLKGWKKKEITDLILSLKPQKVDTYFNQNNYSGILDVFAIIPYWETKLKVRNLNNNKKALRIMENLGKNIPGSSLSSRIEERNPDLRKHVKTGFMHCASYDNFRFLDDDFDNQFNPLDEMRIHAALIEQNKKKQLPPLIRWVNNSQNETYKAFLIEEIGFFNQQESASKLLELFQVSKSNKVKAKIVETLGLLKYIKAIPIFLNEYGVCSEQVQAAIVSVLGESEPPEAIEFLKEVYAGTSNEGLIIKIVQNIYKLDHEKETFFTLKQNASGVFQKSIFDFVEQA
ncbi:HEAT repeat domain-containing protein [Dysgonomonas sp. Marseille-P4677]|uniref:HEAT repeat domain-containing protein n=1 Tax=Dysgonomonas sp. Marseille-P4677 TaxID=2364790 RepID=UPI001911C995|nr:HEAT repeat domain-containing protein [Dysgonomonas sp. Marseille-P4677]MBK5722417.1 HEAT repeat domain-containing protein [Dysgonomonas sp. Marseille-P4677]